MQKTKVYCSYCGKQINAKFIKKHTKECPINDENLKKILIWIREFIDKSSNFTEVLVIPEAKHYDAFSKANKILGYQSLRKMFEEREWWDIVIDLVAIGIENNVVTDDEFPNYYRSLYDNFLFLTEKDFIERYKRLSNHEDSHLGYN